MLGHGRALRWGTHANTGAADAAVAVRVFRIRLIQLVVAMSLSQSDFVGIRWAGDQPEWGSEGRSITRPTVVHAG